MCAHTLETHIFCNVRLQAYAQAAFEPATLNVHAHLVRGVATACTSIVFIVSGIASVRMMWDAITSRLNLELPTSMPIMDIENNSPSPVSETHIASSGFQIPNPAARLWRVPVFYIFLISARFLMIGLFYPIIRRTLGSFSWKEYILLSWGGLRGAVCLILALLMEQEEDVDKSLSTTASLYISSSAFLILLLNGLSFEFVFKLLQPYTANPFKKVYLRRVMRVVSNSGIMDNSVIDFLPIVSG